MIRILQLKLPVLHTEKELEEKILHTLRIRPEELKSWKIVRRSIDARKKDTLCFVYQIDVETPKEKKILARSKHNEIMSIKPGRYHFPNPGDQTLRRPPVVIGSGPAGLFCAYWLAKSGYCPVLLERGDEAHVRREKVERFWNTGVLDTESNVQFGEGGAGTFSDGKLNTTVKDSSGRNHEVLRIFCEAGAPEEILYDQKPHLGTDQLITIVQNMRRQIETWGGTVRFGAQVTDFDVPGGSLAGVVINGEEYLETELAVLAIGHSARDTFFLLDSKGILMEQKSFAVGVRIEHPQAMIDENQYGSCPPKILGAAPYKLTHTCGNGRGVYSFCMCPGGYVVNASSEEGMTAVNGMSYSDRSGPNANSAMIVTVGPADFASCHQEGTSPVLDGIAFQRRLERAAFRAGNGKIPVQLFGDFCENRVSAQLGDVEPSICGAWTFGDVRSILPETVSLSLAEGIRAFDRKIAGFARADAVLSGVESRTSSPLRIVRNSEFESSIRGIYPCGEGAGYAGGITSAAMDGLKIAEAISKKYKNLR